MEITFANKAVMDDLKKFTMLKSKITNNLMQWHSAWSLLIDVTELEMSESLHHTWSVWLITSKGYSSKKL